LSECDSVKLTNRLKPKKNSSIPTELEPAKPDLSGRLFPFKPSELLNTILDEEGLKKDRDGKIRMA